MLNLLEKCELCPRRCGINRLNGEIGFCKSGKDVKLARADLHFWEEPCISGSNGSGTVFFSNCNLNCVFCQNHCISQDNLGKEVSIERLSEIFLNLQKKGANNINLVTPTHYIPQIIEALKLSKKAGLNIPILYNTNGYDSVDALRVLDGLIDVYLPDLKYFNNKYSVKYSKAPEYFQNAAKAIDEMIRQVGFPKFDENGIIQKGVIIRHLMLPGLLFDSKKVIDYIYAAYGESAYISIMNQYTPMHKAYEYPEINKKLSDSHYDSLINYALNLGIKNGFIQESGTNSEDFVPDFISLKGI